MQSKPVKKHTKQYLFTETEKNANLFNIKCLAILCILVLICELFNEIGIFKVPAIVMRLSTVLAFVVLSIPLIVFLFHNVILHKEKSIIKMNIFKHIILISTYIGIGLLCITLSFHAIILLAIPPLIAAQYPNSKKLFVWIMAMSLLMVPVGVYGSFFFGIVDRNFIKGIMTEEDFAILSNRLSLATSPRMLELFIHYVIPRLLGVAAIVLLVFGITRRNGIMIDKEIKLNNQINQEMEYTANIQNHVIDSLSTLIETRDVGTGEHVIRTKKYVSMIADRLKQKEKYKDILTDEYIRRIENAAPLHDVGKIAISDTILLKPGKLTPEEFDQIKTHTTKGESMIKNIFSGIENDLFLETAEQIAVSHHEKWDGSGYPKGLKGDDIPLPARIMAVADVYDALISVRPYKDKMPPQQAIDIILSESGSHFDPEIIEVVKELRDELIYASTLPLEKM